MSLRRRQRRKSSAAQVEQRVSQVDSATRERLRIAGRAEVAGLVQAMAGGATPPAGALGEVQAAAGVPSNVVPWECLVAPDGLPARPVLQHADALSPAASYTNAPSGLAAVIDYVFGRSVAMTGLNARMVSPDGGDAVLAVITEAAETAIKARGAALEASTKAITAGRLEPKRLQSRIMFAWEDQIRLGDALERSLREHLRRAAAETLDTNVLGTQTSPVAGVLAPVADGGLPAVTAASTALDYAASLALVSNAIDGVHASGAADINLLIRPEVAGKLRSLSVTGTDATAAAAVEKLVNRVIATKHLPAPSSNVSTGIIARTAAVPGSGLVIAVWSRGMEILTDRNTESKQGGIILTLRQGVSWALTHKDAYSRVSAKTA